MPSEKCQEAPCETEVERIRKNEKTAKQEIKEHTKKKVENFAKAILKVLNDYVTQQDKDYDLFLGCSESERITVSVEFPLYQQSQACYAVNKLIDKQGKVERRTSYSEGQRCSASFQDIEVKRDIYETLLVTGKIFFEWKGIKSIVSLFFQGNYSEANFIHCKKDRKIMKEFQAELREFMKKNNYFKGEKLEFMPYSNLKFLKYPSLSWDSLILKEDLKEEIDLNLIFPLHNQYLCKKHKVPWRRGVLLAGVPGTGKTQLGRVLCNELNGITVIWATCKAIHDVSRVKTLFDIARDFAPTLIIMEDIDFFGHDREFIVDPIVGELLNQLDGSAPNEGVFILATTNRPHLLDRALADRPSRFDVKLLFNLPELEERKRMVELFTQGKILEFPKDYLAETTDKLTGAHIKEVINYAMLLALKNGLNSIDKEYIDRALRKVKDKLEKKKSVMVS